jgi:hypothetical protein
MIRALLLVSLLLVSSFSVGSNYFLSAHTSLDFQTIDNNNLADPVDEHTQLVTFAEWDDDPDDVCLHHNNKTVCQITSQVDVKSYFRHALDISNNQQIRAPPSY